MTTKQIKAVFKKLGLTKKVREYFDNLRRLHMLHCEPEPVYEYTTSGHTTPLPELEFHPVHIDPLCDGNTWFEREDEAN